MSKLKELSEERCELEMTPMIDVTFLLLIFFLCTLKFKTLEGYLAGYLPKDAGPVGTTEPPPEPIDLEVSVLEEGTRISAVSGRPFTAASHGRFDFGPDRVLQYRVGPRFFATPAAVAARVLELSRLNPDRKVTIDVTPGVVYGEVVPVLDGVLGAGLRDIRFKGAR